MFFSSVLVPSSSLPAGPHGDVGVDAQAALLHVDVGDAELAHRRRAAAAPTAAASAALRRSGSVTISTSGVPPRLKSTSEAPEPWMRPDSPTWTIFAASSSRWARWMRTSPRRPLAGKRDVVLADLVGLRAVGIEVVLAVEDRARRHLALQRRGDLQRVADRLLVGHRQHPGVGEADRAGVDVGLVAEGELAAAEHLRPGRRAGRGSPAR